MQQRTAIFVLLLVLAGSMTLVGCGGDNQNNGDQAEQTQAAESPDTSQQAASEPAPEPACANCGTVVSIQERDAQRGNTSKEAIGGAVAGAVAGVVAGNQVGSGSGKDIAQIIGGIGGAVAGHQAGKRAFTESYYVVRVDMESGGTRAINVPEVGGLAVGQEVRVDGQTIIPR